MDDPFPISHQQIAEAVPLIDRRRRTRWDCAPEGMERLGADQYKLLGLAVPGVRPDLAMAPAAVHEVMAVPPLSTETSWVARTVLGKLDPVEVAEVFETMKIPTGKVVALGSSGERWLLPSIEHVAAVKKRWPEIVSLPPQSNPRAIQVLNTVAPGENIPSSVEAAVAQASQIFGPVRGTRTSDVLPGAVSPVVPRVFVFFETVDAASAALHGFPAQKFDGPLAGRPLVTAVFDGAFAEFLNM